MPDWEGLLVLGPAPGSHQRCCLAKAAVKNVLPAGAPFRGQDI